ncbi:MAG: hypothetical protein KY463_15475 [Actinobacteria bacterium]|nr:hypothetical protein [Actinomycetota bacterium]
MHATSSSARRSPDRRAVAVAVVVIVVYGAALVRGERSAHVAASLQEIHAEPDDVVLLAPACASMDQFADYAHRGAAFRAAVGQLQGASSGH